MFNSIAYANNAAQAAPNFMQQYGTLFMMLAFVAIFYVLVLRPQKKKQQELQNQLKTLRSGDKVLLTSGIFGTVDSVADNNTFMINIGGNTKIHVVQSAIAQKLSDTRPESI